VRLQALRRSKSVEEFASQPFDLVITVCDNANETCPVFPDPAAIEGSLEDRLVAFRDVRDRIADRIFTFLKIGQTGAV
jgi:arsenate reductase (thioredoxin)